MPSFTNPYEEERKPSPGEKEVVAGSYLVGVFRILGIRMPYKKDVDAVSRTGELVRRWFRGAFRST